MRFDSPYSDVLEESEWTASARRHAERIDDLLGKHVERRSRGEKDPVTDFLFEYYGFRVSHLKRWSPGVGIALSGRAARDYLRWDEFSFFESKIGPVVALDPRQFPERLRTSTEWILDLLRRTQERPPMFGCAGLHEWAMVYRTENPRHPWPGMRVSEETISSVVESGPLACTHFDAFRFFTAQARPLNRIQPVRSDMPRLEQGGCLHVNMDIYRWAAKRAPWIESDLVADALEFALEIREVDMRASPYDVSELGLKPIPVESDAGRAEYRTHQERFYHRGRELRERLIESYERLAGLIAEKPPQIAIRAALS